MILDEHEKVVKIERRYKPLAWQMRDRVNGENKNESVNT